jgi:arsenate reductase
MAGVRTILFLCTGNSARSQMAEGFARAHNRPGLRVFSAGTEPRAVHPMAVEAMREIGIDISGQRAKGLAEVPLEGIDLVVTLCEGAAESCPAFPRPLERLHWPLPDPAGMEGTPEFVQDGFRMVRDDLERHVRALLATLPLSRP